MVWQMENFPTDESLEPGLSPKKRSKDCTKISVSAHRYLHTVFMAWAASSVSNILFRGVCFGCNEVQCCESFERDVRSSSVQRLGNSLILRGRLMAKRLLPETLGLSETPT